MQIRTKIFLFSCAQSRLCLHSARVLSMPCPYPATFCPRPVRVLFMPLSTSFSRPVRTSARVQSAFYSCHYPLPSLVLPVPLPVSSPLSARSRHGRKGTRTYCKCVSKKIKTRKKRRQIRLFSGSGGGIRTYDLSGMNRSL